MVLIFTLCFLSSFFLVFIQHWLICTLTFSSQYPHIIHFLSYNRKFIMCMYVFLQNTNTIYTFLGTLLFHLKKYLMEIFKDPQVQVKSNFKNIFIHYPKIQWIWKKFSNVCYIFTESVVSLKLQICQCLPSGYSLKNFKFIKDQRRGNSLVVQWLGLGAFTAVGLDSVPGQGTKTHKLCSQINQRHAQDQRHS